jgi:hypothetical protein
MMDSQSAVLRAKIELVKPALDRATAAMWTHPSGAAMYREWLLTLHGMIRATVPLMLLATQRCLAMDGDPVAARLGEYFGRHIREEYGHDGWLVEDLLAAGGSMDNLSGFVPGPEIASVVGSQYYWIRHAHPVSLVGHIAVLEGYPPSGALSETLAERTGLPLTAFRTITRHATLDQRHRDDVLRLIDALPLDAALTQLLGVSALHTVNGLIAVAERAAQRVTSGAS